MLAVITLWQSGNLDAAFGGADQDRTGDLLNAIQALSQLSYSPTFGKDKFGSSRVSPNCGVLQSILFRRNLCFVAGSGQLFDGRSALINSLAQRIDPLHQNFQFFGV